ncbi:G-type lectin S-receptor-like serine/threonine-protein kinase RKS1 isoform X1 [Zingiber officinale]|uniref:G-type lectin S-receptor-like serine/threonine-protein kinase RKS1 isoform X1 n=1 Tax=Zingiber officinale TaxID=94328 RepID=UPI001C4D9845|nr:G-type lectin S-receptor-like serine/threonine-protein kinase RKS1 isoform X1 [Zingiber officinale]
MQLFLSCFLKTAAVTFFILGQSSSSGDAMIENSSLINGQTLTSTGDIFQLGFFRLDGNTSAKGYLGIWYCNFTPQEGIVVWIANRNMSVNTSMASFNLTSDGNLILFEGDINVWSTGTRSTGVNSSRLQLLDSGNLVLNDNNSILWQSFEDSNDSATYLPGMKLGFDNRTNTSWREVSWKNPTDPSPGDYIQMIRDLPIPDLVFFNGSAKYHRGGLWNGNWFVGHPLMASSQLANLVNVTFVSNENESYIMNNYTASPTPLLTRSVMWANGTFQRWSLDSGGKREWQLLWSIPADECDSYNHCGRNRVCTNKYFAVECQCLDGFVNITENGREAGCERKKPLNCSSNQFSKVQNVKVPDTENATPRGNMSLDDCKNLCLNDCSCVAYAVISGSYGCITWLGDLLDLRTFVDEGDDLYVRLTGKNNTGRRILFIVIPIAATLLFLCAFFIYRQRIKATTQRQKRHADHTDQHEIRGTESLLFDLEAIRIATDNFSDRNKLGEGGFGSVYKGTLENGEHVAVKRLSRSSGQGLDELKNEVFLVAKLRHRNLVRLLGCCLDSEEKLLVYNYLANTSLDKFLFDNSKREQLDWARRFKIIEGISRGLLYLHEDSPVKIIHRDLKASNILLDANMDPKISDFGLAKLFGADETHGNTKRIAGTFGYMSPEYATHGLFSVKSDVYSYGVLVLEILIGRKNIGYRGSEHPIELVTHVVWRHWTQGSALQVVDQDLVEQCQAQQILRCIHIGLLCVQDDPIQRPTMANVVLMLNNHFVGLPTPLAPAFLGSCNTTIESNGVPRRENSNGSKGILMKNSENNVSISELEPR